MTANIEPLMEQEILNLLNTLKEQSPQMEREGTMKRSARENVTMVPGGMLYEHKGKTRAVWDADPEPKGGNLVRIAICILIAGIVVMCVTWIELPVIAFVAPWALAVWLFIRQYRHPGKREHCARCNGAQEAAQRPARSVWDVYPRQAPYSETDRIGDAERDQVIKELGVHMVAGRLNADEHESRVTRALNATNHRELIPVLESLPFLEIHERRVES